ncbi:protein rep [Clostridium butyricum]
MQDNNSKKLNKNQMEILSDKNKKGKERPWIEKKIKSIMLADSYKRLGFKKAYSVQECGTYLEFKRYESGDFKLNASNFCKDRLCPMCAWRRSLKIFGQTSKVMDRALQDKDYRFIFLTLTCKNVYGEELSSTIDQLFKAFNLMFKRKQVKTVVKGWFRGLEVTHNLDEESKDYDTYHPHFHIVIMVNKSYFTDKRYYLSQAKWTKIWQESLGVDYTPIVNIKAFKVGTKTQTSKSVSESAKYTVKDNDYLIEGSEELTDSAVMILNNSLKGRRLVAFGGVFRKIHKELNLDDMEKGDLINTDSDETLRDDIKFTIERYKWNVGYNQYYKF